MNITEIFQTKLLGVQGDKYVKDMQFSFQVVSSIHMFSNIDIQIYIKIRSIKHIHIH